MPYIVTITFGIGFICQILHTTAFKIRLMGYWKYEMDVIFNLKIGNNVNDLVNLNNKIMK